MNACFVANAINVICGTGANNHSFATGLVADVVRSVGRRLLLTVRETCIESIDDAFGCDVVAGALRQETIYASPGWIASGTYDVDTTAVLFVPENALAPWSFLLPFAPSLWIVIIAVILVVSPLVSSVVEYDDGETLAENLKTYLPDNVHAYTGVDALKRSGSDYSKESALLSAAVAIVGKILIALYSCNLAAYVIASSYMDSTSTTSTDEAVSRGKIAVTPGFYVNATDIVRAESVRQGLRMYRNGSVRALVSGQTYLKSVQTCKDAIGRLNGPYIFKTMALSDNFSLSKAFDAELRKQIIEISFPQTDTLRCPKVAQSVGLESTLGIFATFAACILAVSAVSVIGHMCRHEDLFAKRETPEGPDSLPESYHE